MTVTAEPAELYRTAAGFATGILIIDREQSKGAADMVIIVVNGSRAGYPVGVIKML